MDVISIEPFSTISGEPVLPLSDSDQDRPPSNKDQKSRTRIRNLLAADLKNLFLIWTWRRKPSGGGGSGFSAIPEFLLSFIASVGCGFSAIRKALLSLIPSGGGGGGDGGISVIPKVFIFFIAIFMLWVRIIIKLYYLGLCLIWFFIYFIAFALASDLSPYMFYYVFQVLSTHMLFENDPYLVIKC